jgi:hypothetical protein
MRLFIWRIYSMRPSTWERKQNLNTNNAVLTSLYCTSATFYSDLGMLNQSRRWLIHAPSPSAPHPCMLTCLSHRHDLLHHLKLTTLSRPSNSIANIQRSNTTNRGSHHDDAVVPPYFVVTLRRCSHNRRSASPPCKAGCNHRQVHVFFRALTSADF